MNANVTSDEMIITLLFERRESALERIREKYSRTYMSVIRRAVDNDADAEECANDLLLAVWNSIPPNRPKYLQAYVCRLARNVGVKRHRYNTRKKRNTEYVISLSELEDCLPSQEVEGAEQSERLAALISDFVKSLDPETRVLFIRRYVCLEPVGELAERFGMKEAAVSTRLWRARKKLQKLLEKEEVL